MKDNIFLDDKLTSDKDAAKQKIFLKKFMKLIIYKKLMDLKYNHKLERLYDKSKRVQKFDVKKLFWSDVELSSQIMSKTVRDCMIRKF